MLSFYGHLFKSTDRLHFQYVLWFVTSFVLEDTISSRGHSGRPARTHKVKVNFITIFTDLELVEDIFKAHIVNIFSATSLTDTYSDCFTCS